MLTAPLAVTAVTAALAAAVGCSTSSSTASVTSLVNRNVVVAAVPATGATGLYIAQQDGFFAAAGLNVTIESSVSAADTIPDLLHGKVDVTLGQWTSAIAAEANGVKLRAIAAGNNGGPGLETLATLSGSPIKQVTELKGKTIAINVLGGLSQMLVESVLSTSGVPPSQVKFTVVPFPLMAEALAAHRVDAAFMVEPYLSEAEQTQGVTELTDIDQGPTSDFPITGYFATAQWAAKYPATAAAFVSALERGQALAGSDRAAVEQVMIRFVHISQQTASIMSLGTFPVGVNRVQLRRVADLMRFSQLLHVAASGEAPVISSLTEGG